MKRSPSRGFTLVELLVVIAILALLLALLLPAVQSARESARRGSCANNLKQLATAVASHLGLVGHYPTGGWDSSQTGNPDLGSDWRQPGGWAYTILPFMGETNTYNAATRNTINVPVFACPTRRNTSIGPGGVIVTDYAGNRGAWASDPSASVRETTFGMAVIGGSPPLTEAAAAQAAAKLNEVQTAPGGPLTIGSAVATGGIIFVGSALLPVRIRDGASNTYLVAEKYVPQAFYASGTTGYLNAAYVGDSPDTLRGGHRVPLSDQTPWAADGQAGAFGGPHPGGFNAAFCDGSVRALDFGIDPQTHFLLSAREDRQPVSPP